MTFSHMLLPLATAALAFVAGEFALRRAKAPAEYSRKLVHVLHGLTVVWWAYRVPFAYIMAFELAFLVIVLATRRVQALRWLHDVQRLSWGDVFFPLGVIAAGYIAHSQAYFVAAVLQLTLTDTVAALIGKRYGSRGYRVFGARKSWVGTASGAVCAALILLAMGVSLPLALGGAVVLMVAENAGVYGSDNLLLPAVCAAYLAVGA